MKLSFIISALEEYAPLSLQEKWDNSGLQVGLPPEADGECTGALLCVDVTEAIIAEAVDKGCNLVISHHPLIFKGLKTLCGRTPAERIAAAAVRAGVAVYSSHTALDSTRGGVTYEMAARLGATPIRVLAPSGSRTALVTVTCPRTAAADVRLILLDSDTAHCDYFNLDSERINPESADSLDCIVAHTPLCRVEARVNVSSVAMLKAALRAMPGSDNIRVEVQSAADDSAAYGLGLVASFEKPVKGAELLAMVKDRFGITTVKSSAAFDPEMLVRRIALCGGSGGEFIATAASLGAQVYITADVRYHDFADAATLPMTIFDIGHFESEACAKDIFNQVIKNKFHNFPVYYSELESNPVKYL